MNKEKWQSKLNKKKTAEDWVESKDKKKKTEKMKRLSVEIPLQMHKDLKKTAVDKELKMNILVIQSIQNFLDNNPSNN